MRKFGLNQNYFFNFKVVWFLLGNTEKTPKSTQHTTAARTGYETTVKPQKWFL